MRWCRIRFVLLGLILCVVHVVSGTCGQRFTDPASSALLSDVVIEGKVRNTSYPETGQAYNITVNIRKRVLKGAQFINGGLGAKKITIAKFKKGDKDLVNCIGSVKGGRSYFFFLKDTKHPKGLHFEIIAMPIKKTSNMSIELSKILCDHCAKTPTISKLTGPDSLLDGNKATLTCAAESKPNPQFSWYKDGELLRGSKKGVRIKSRKRQSTLQIKRATQNDTGIYECVAVNAVGEARKNFTVKIRHNDSLSLSRKYTEFEKEPEKKVIDHGHSTLCPGQTFCLNGGTCLFIHDIINQFCKCPEQWAGRRCELLDAFGVKEDYNQQAGLLFERTLIIIGIVIAVLVFIIISIASYILAKNRRKRFEIRRKRREAHSKQRPPVLVDRGNNTLARGKESDSTSEIPPPDFSPKHRLFILQDSSLSSGQKPSHRNFSELPLQQQQLSDMKVDPHEHHHESRQRLAASSVYENVTDSRPLTFSNDGDFPKYKSTAATVHPESIELNVLQETKADNILDTSKNICSSVSKHNTGNNEFVDPPASLQPQPPEHLSSTSQSPHKYYQITGTSPLSTEPNLEPLNPLVPSHSLLLSSSQSILPHQHFQDEAYSRDEKETAKQPLLNNHNMYAPTQNSEYSVRPFESKSERDLARYVMLGSNQRMYPNRHDLENNCLFKLPHSNTFPKSKVNGQALDMYSESDDEDEMEVPYEKQLHISEEDLMLSQEALENSSFFIVTTPTRQTAHEDLVMGLLPNSVISRPGMRKYQSEEGPAYSKFSGKNFALLQLSARSRSLDDPLGAGEDGPDPMRLNSTMAGSPDVETYDSMIQQPAQLHNSMYSYDPNDDSMPWDGDINKTDFLNLAKEERDTINRMRDVLPDQQPIPI